MADNLSVAVTADTSALRAQLALAQADLRAFGAETKKLATEIRGGGDASGVLRGPLERVAGQFNRAKAEVGGLAAELGKARSQHAEHNTILGLARERLAGFGAAAVGAREQLVGSFEKIHGAFLALTGLVAGGALFREAIRDTLQFNGEVIGLVRTLGVEREEALQLTVALRLIGKTTEEYTGVIFKLERQLRTNEERLNQLGIKTRDVHGEYLKGPEIFKNALAAMQEYRAGTDQNLFALEAFGKGAKEVYDFIRLNDATMQRAAQLIKDFNIELQDPSAIRQYRIEMAALQLVWEQIEEEITSALLPALTALAQYLNSGGLNAVGLFTAELRGLAAMAVMLGTSWLRLKSVSEEAWDGIVEIMRSAAAKGRAIMTGAWGELEALSREHETRMTGIAAAGEEERVQIMLRETAAMRQIFGLREEGAVTLPDVTVKSGTKSYTVKDKGGGRARAAKAPKEEKDDSEQRELARLSTEEKVDDAILDRRTKLIEATKAAGKISLDQQTQLLIAQLDRKWALEQDYFAKKIAAAQGDDKEQQKLQDQELIAYQNYLTKRQDLDTKYFEAKKAAEQKAAADSKAALDKALAPIEKGFDQAIQGFLQGTQSLKQALQKGLQAIILEPLIENVKNGLKTALTSAFSGSNIQGSG